MLLAVGQGGVPAADVISLGLGNAAPSNGRKGQQAPVVGASGYQVKLARCCQPHPGDDVVGYVTRQTKVSVHRAGCPTLHSKPNIAERIIPVQWVTTPQSGLFDVRVQFRTVDRAGMMGIIGDTIARENINLSNVMIFTDDQGDAIFHVTMQIDSYATLSRILTKVESLEGVIDARRRTTEEPKQP